MWEFILFSIIAYLLGSLMPGYWIGKLIYHKNIRDMGSGNIGTTNSFRILGVVPGTITMLLDIAKGFLAVYLPLNFSSLKTSSWAILFIGMFAIIGHVYSIFLSFHGGKAVATSAGVVMAFDYKFFLVALVIMVVSIFISSRVSIGSMTTFILMTIYAWVVTKDVALGVFAIIATEIMLYAHRANIVRLAKGTESYIHFGLYYWLVKKEK